jgi:hypothetical protein
MAPSSLGVNGKAEWGPIDSFGRFGPELIGVLGG